MAKLYFQTPFTLINIWNNNSLLILLIFQRIKCNFDVYLRSRNYSLICVQISVDTNTYIYVGTQAGKQGRKFFHHLSLRIVVSVSEYIFLVSNKKKTQKQKAKETHENKKTNETKEKEKENVVVNNICGKSNGIR